MKFQPMLIFTFFSSVLISLASLLVVYSGFDNLFSLSSEEEKEVIAVVGYSQGLHQPPIKTAPVAANHLKMILGMSSGWWSI